MKTKIPVILFFAMIASFNLIGQGSSTSGIEPWTAAQLLDPAVLAKTLNNTGSLQPYIFCIGPQSVIKGTIDIGPTREKANLEEFQKQLEKLPKDANIVVYCGCCPFASCPNVRPAFELLNKMQFRNHKLLNLPRNVKVDWIDKGYPIID